MSLESCYTFPPSFLDKKEIAFCTLHFTVFTLAFLLRNLICVISDAFYREIRSVKILDAKKEKKHSGYFFPFPDLSQSQAEEKHHMLEPPPPPANGAILKSGCKV